jgi:hypothetical protein
VSKKHHNWQLPGMLEAYAEERSLDFQQYSEFHLRLIYKPVVVFDCWTTEKYYIKETDYFHDIIERGGETGFLPTKKKQLYDFLDKIFFAVEMKEA